MKSLKTNRTTVRAMRAAERALDLLAEESAQMQTDMDLAHAEATMHSDPEDGVLAAILADVE